MKKILLSPWLAVFTLIFLILIRFVDPGFVESVRLRGFDQLVTGQPEKSVPVHVVNIDESSLERYGQWPFPREQYAEIIEELYKRGAGLVVWGVMMPEKDRFGGDQRLSETIKNNPIILPEVASTSSKNKAGDSKAQVVGLDPSGKIVEYPGIISNIEIIRKNAAGIGVANTFPEVDGVVRRMPMIVMSEGVVYPSLALETIRVAVDDSRFQVKIDQAGVAALRVPKWDRITTDGLGRIWIDYANTAKSHSLTKLPENFNGEIVIVGLSAAGLVQPVATSKGEMWPQELQAAVIGTLLNKTHISRPVTADIYEMLFMLVAGLVLISLMRWTYVGIISTVVLVSGTIIGSIYGYSKFLWLLDATATSLCLVLVALHAFIAKFLNEYFQKQQIKQQFGSYVNPVIVERLQKNPEFIKLGGEKRELTILMSDMRNFTGLGETYGDDVVGFTAVMNRYMTAIAEPILRNNGCLIKFIGDASLHVHGAPIQEKQDPDHVIAGVRTALEMLDAVEMFNRELEAEGKPKVGMGLGVNTGPTLIGNIGAKTRFAYDVLGDSVSLTARLESQTKNYGVLIIISEFTQARVGDEFFTIELDNIAVKGKNTGVTIYTVFNNPDANKREAWLTARELHELMLDYYRQQKWDKAVELVNSLRGEFDGLMNDYYDLWLDRIEDMKSRNLPEDWDGTYRATSK